MGAPTSPSQIITSRENSLNHESHDLLDNSIGKPEPRDGRKLDRNCLHKTFEKGKTKPARPPDVSTNPNKSHVSRSQDTTDERWVREPDRHHPSCSGLSPHRALFWKNTHEEHWPGGLELRILGVIMPYAFSSSCN